jgi:hypothetical protein
MFYGINPLILWHGTHRWEGPPRLMPAGKGKSEHGSGLYLTTSPDTARHYARGGGNILRFEIDPDLVFLDEVEIDLADAFDLLNSIPRLRNRSKIIQDISRVSNRVGRQSVPGYVIENLLSAHGALKGEVGPAVARWFVSLGIDASVVDPPMFTRQNSDEQWLVLYNLDKVISYQRVARDETYDVPRIRAREG